MVCMGDVRLQTSAHYRDGVLAIARLGGASADGTAGPVPATTGVETPAAPTSVPRLLGLLLPSCGPSFSSPVAPSASMAFNAPFSNRAPGTLLFKPLSLPAWYQKALT